MGSKFTVNTGIIGTVKVPVPYQAKGKSWALVDRPVAINIGQKAADAERFAAELRKSFEAFIERERARPAGDGREALGNGRRGELRPTTDYRGKRVPSMRVDKLPKSTLHRHSARCLVPLEGERPYLRDGSGYGEAPAIRGWVRCNKVPYPFHPLHRHHTKRGRSFLVSHLPGIACPFDI